MPKIKTAPTTDLLAAIADANASAAASAQQQRDAARMRYWRAVARLADADPSGGTDASGFASDLALLDLTPADVQRDVDAIRSVRAAEQHHDAVIAAQAQAIADRDTAVARRDALIADLADARIAADRASWFASDVGEQLGRATAKLAEARATEADLRSRGLTAILTKPLPPPAPPAPRRWRLASAIPTPYPLDSQRICAPGSIVALPADCTPQCPPWAAVPADDPTPADPVPPIRLMPGYRVLAHSAEGQVVVS